MNEDKEHPQEQYVNWRAPDTGKSDVDEHVNKQAVERNEQEKRLFSEMEKIEQLHQAFAEEYKNAQREISTEMRKRNQPEMLHSDDKEEENDDYEAGLIREAVRGWFNHKNTVPVSQEVVESIAEYATWFPDDSDPLAGWLKERKEWASEQGIQ